MNAFAAFRILRIVSIKRNFLVSQKHHTRVGTQIQNHKMSSEDNSDYNDNGLEPSYTGLVATARAENIEDFHVLDIDTDNCFGFLKKNYYDAKVCLQQYTISTGEEAPRDLLTFCFDEDAYHKRKELGNNLVMEKFFRSVFVHEGSNPFEHGAYGTFVMYYMHEEEGCPGASFNMPLDIPALLVRLQQQASIDWNRKQNMYGACKISVHADDDESD